ncbi:S-methyl-5'-thioadenosine phosphorylase [Candidatus Tiddalikarchaeum anstoanum]|nr:S-methyl-5'-thioadenosine phosphorylase [Candidatus Tiddalikarchaeum anstoanum]
MKVGIIGGSGLDDPKILKDCKEVDIDTVYGKPSSTITYGKLNNTDVYILARHGKKHQIPPTFVNNRANIQALKNLGCTHIIATTAVGSLREEIGRGDFVVLSDFIDFTRRRILSFFDDFKDGPKHVSLANPFSGFLRKKIIDECERLKYNFHKEGTVVTIEGPRFSTVAESKMFRQWGADVINMSIAPEAILAREAEIEYAGIAMSTDYDCWKTDEMPVSWDDILKIFNENADKMKKLLVKVVESLNEKKEEEYIKSLIRTVPDWPKKGIMFRDITTLLKDAEGFRLMLDILEEHYKNIDIDLIAGIESRGFVLASALASKLGKGVILIRKKGKLPAETVSESYDLEYGQATIEIHKDAIKHGQRILLLDDLLATGGTALAAGNLIEKLGGKVVEVGFIVELPELKGRKKLKWPVFKIVDFKGE